MDFAKEKKAYQLWYEYLKRSVKYKDFCDCMRAKREEGIELPERYKKKNGFVPPIAHVYIKFFDVHRYEFEEIWQYWQENIEHNKNFIDNLPGARGDIRVLDQKTFTGWLERELKDFYERFKQDVGREPTIEEFIRLLPKYSFRIYSGLYIHISDPVVRDRIIEDQFPKKIGKKVTHIVKNKQKKERGRASSFRLTTNYFRFDELKRYLEVFDSRESGEDWEDIIKQYEPQSDSNEKNTRDKYLDYYGKAKNLIRNTERGIFPGDY